MLLRRRYSREQPKEVVPAKEPEVKAEKPKAEKPKRTAKAKNKGEE